MAFKFDSEAFDNASKTIDDIVHSGRDLIEYYVLYANSLCVASDGDIDYEYYYLSYVVDMLKNIILGRLLKERGYFVDNNDEFHRYRKDL